MSDFQELTFKDVAEFVNGKAFKPSDWSKSGKPIIRIQNLNNSLKEFNYYEGEIEEKYLVNNNDLLISWSASLGVFIWKGEQAVLNQHIFKVNIFENVIDKNYFYFLAKTKITEMSSKIHGSTMKHITKKDFDKIKLTVPPLPVQKQIVSILEKAENLKQKREITNKDTQKIIQSLFYEMFGDPVKNEKGWDVKTLSEIGEVGSGSTPKTNNKEFWNGDVNWITPAELIDGDNYYYYETERKISQLGLKSIGNRLFPVGTVMLTTRAPIGKVAIAGSEMCSNQGFKNIICNNKLIHPVYLYVWLLTRKDYLNSIGTGATFKEISKKTVENVSLSVPPLPLQEEFAKRVQLIESIQSKQQSSTQEINTLFDALMQKAFKGELMGCQND